MSLKIHTPQPAGIPGHPSPARTPAGSPQRPNKSQPSSPGLNTRVSMGSQGAAMAPRIELTGIREPMAQMERLLNGQSVARPAHTPHTQLQGVRNPAEQMQVNLAQQLLGAIAHAQLQASRPPDLPAQTRVQAHTQVASHIKPMLFKPPSHTQPHTQGNWGSTHNAWAQNMPSAQRSQLRRGLEHAKTRFQHASTALPKLPVPIRIPIALALAVGIRGIEKLLSHLAKPPDSGSVSAGPQPWPTQMHMPEPLQMPTQQQPAAPAAASAGTQSSSPEPSVLAAPASKPQRPASQPTTAPSAKPPAKPSVARPAAAASATPARPTPTRTEIALPATLGGSQLVTSNAIQPHQKPSVTTMPSLGSQALARPMQQATSASSTLPSQPARPRTESVPASTSNAIVLSTTQPPQSPTFTVAPEALARPTHLATGASATPPLRPTPSKIKIDSTTSSGGGQLVASNAIQPHQNPSVTATKPSESQAVVARPKLSSMSRTEAQKALEACTSPEKRASMANAFFLGQKTNADALEAAEKELSEKIDISGASRRDISVLLSPYKTPDKKVS